MEHEVQRQAGDSANSILILIYPKKEENQKTFKIKLNVFFYLKREQLKF